MSDLETILTHSLFSDVENLTLPHNSLVRVSLNDGQMLFDQMENSHDFYLVLSGAMLAVYLATDGKELIFHRYEAPDFLGETASVDGGDQSLAVYASGPTEVMMLRREAFLQMIEDHPVIRDRIMQRLALRVRELTTRSSQLSTQSVDQRVKAYIARTAMDAGAFHPGGVLKGLPTQSEIAGLIGANREAVSRAISHMKRSGVIEAGRQRITLVQPDSLIEAGIPT